MTAIFPHPSRPALGTHPASYTMSTGSFPEVKQSGRGVDHQPLSSAEVKERKRYPYFLSGPPWPVVVWPLPLLYIAALINMSGDTVNLSYYPQTLVI